MNHKLILLLLCACFFLPAPAFSQSLESIERQIASIDSQIAAFNKEYVNEKKANEQRMKRQELTQAYASAERLDFINQQLNQLRSHRARLCEQWRAHYRKTVDESLISAERESDKKKKAEIGKKLHALQAQNIRLCPTDSPSLISQEWRSLQVESYDGPQEIQQKLQLLKDISRELMISLARLDNQHQEALREKRTKDRAQEFIQEGTLFNDVIAVRSTTTTTPGTPASSPVEFVDRSSSDTANQGSSGVAVGVQEWQNKEEGQQIEDEYKKNRAQLLEQQDELRRKMEEFDRKAKSLQIP